MPEAVQDELLPAPIRPQLQRLRPRGTTRFCGVAAKVPPLPGTDLTQVACSNFLSNILLAIPSGDGQGLGKVIR
jgi:hypothetical protein